MTIDVKLIDKLLADHGKRPVDIAGEHGLIKQLTKAVLERAMQAELTDKLGYEKHDPAGYKSGNSRNGKSRKKLKGDFGEIELEVPRDRNGEFEPKIVRKHQTRRIRSFTWTRCMCGCAIKGRCGIEPCMWCLG